MLKTSDLSLFSQSVAKFLSIWYVLYFTEEKLISKNQSGLWRGDSYANQLLAITHELFPSFDENYKIRGVCFDIWEAFDKVCHKGIIYKLKRNGISGNFLSLLMNFLRNRKQIVIILNAHMSSCANINASVLQGSILGLLFFRICINNGSDNVYCNPKLFVDDTPCLPERTANNLNNDLNETNKWAAKNEPQLWSNKASSRGHF